jgi:hypothetical protein
MNDGRDDHKLNLTTDYAGLLYTYCKYCDAIIWFNRDLNKYVTLDSSLKCITNDEKIIKDLLE